MHIYIYIIQVIQIYKSDKPAAPTLIIYSYQRPVYGKIIKLKAKSCPLPIYPIISYPIHFPKSHPYSITDVSRSLVHPERRLFLSRSAIGRDVTPLGYTIAALFPRDIWAFILVRLCANGSFVWKMRIESLNRYIYYTMILGNVFRLSDWCEYLKPLYGTNGADLSEAENVFR